MGTKIKHTRNENGQNFTHQNKTTVFWRKKAKINLHQNFPIYGNWEPFRLEQENGDAMDRVGENLPCTGHPRPFLIHCCCSSWTTVSNLLHTRHTTFSNFYTLICMSQWRVSYLTPSHTTSPRVVICSWEIMPIYISRRSHGLIRKREKIKYIMFLLI